MLPTLLTLMLIYSGNKSIAATPTNTVETTRHSAAKVGKSAGNE
jgi:hypothetical protein